MGLEFQKFYRFLLPGGLFVASNFVTVYQQYQSQMISIEKINSLILFLGLIAVILGIPIYWIYILIHFLWERCSMQKKEVKWVHKKYAKTRKDVYNYSNVIWNFIDKKSVNQNISSWLRSNFLLIHSLGGSITAIVLGFITNIFCIKTAGVLDISYKNLWIYWLGVAIILYIYRRILKNRYLKRLEIFIKLNLDDINMDICEYKLKSGMID